jgi:hypothetical protein
MNTPPGSPQATAAWQGVKNAQAARRPCPRTCMPPFRLGPPRPERPPHLPPLPPPPPPPCHDAASTAGRAPPEWCACLPYPPAPLLGDWRTHPDTVVASLSGWLGRPLSPLLFRFYSGEGGAPWGGRALAAPGWGSEGLSRRRQNRPSASRGEHQLCTQAVFVQLCMQPA